MNTKKLLIFVVAYNAEKTIGSVLSRIPRDRLPDRTDVLVIDDSSADATFEMARLHAGSGDALPLKVLRNPENQGYGGNQKLGYQYAVENGYDCVVLLHGDGQYAPEKMPDLVKPILCGEADACFGSRMLEEGHARAGGMPLYKYTGNRILSSFQNRVLHMQLSEFHSGYRAYSVKALKRIPFQRNSNDFHFDTEIIIQLLAGKMRIREVAIPTYYGDEICHVNGIKYAWNVVKATILYRCHLAGILCQPQFDVETNGAIYDLKDSFVSSHSLAIAAVPKGSKVLDLAGGVGHVAGCLREKGCVVTGVDQEKFAEHKYNTYISYDMDNGTLPEGLEEYDVILLLDCLEHFRNPEGVLDSIRAQLYSASTRIIVSVPNIGFFMTRFALLAGQFNYGRRGILDRTHVRLFTFSSIRRMLEQEGFVVELVRGVPAPFPMAAGKRLGGFLLTVNRALIVLWKRMFSYQIYIHARMLPTVSNLLDRTMANSADPGGTGLE